jgi:hypothetical protein
MRKQLIVIVLFATLVLGLAACGPDTGASASLPDGLPTTAAPSTDLPPTDAPPTDLPPIDPPPTDLPPTDLPPTDLPATDLPATDLPPTDLPPTNPPPTAALPDLSIAAENVVMYPVPTIYAGDKVTFQLLPYVPESINIESVLATILVNGVPVASGPLERRNWNGQAEGVYEWAWDTANQVGEHEIRVVLDEADTLQQGDENPDNNVVALPATVVAATLRPTVEAAAEWVTAETACCVAHVVSDTAAARDFNQLLDDLERAVQSAAIQLNVTPTRKLEVYFIDRVVGQGGFAGSDMVVSYVDRPYAGGGLQELLVHEAVHVLDQEFAPRRIAPLAEGLAVWVTGGHYKLEDLNRRSAALLLLNDYVPLTQLFNDFYPIQHEIGYLQAGGFVSYLVERGGWPLFRDFYSNVTSDDGATLAQAVDVNLQQYYGVGLQQMEADWLTYLQGLSPTTAEVDDLATTVRYYNIMRRYQQAYDPTAYFLTAWLPHPTAVREQGNPADFSRRPKEEINITLEVMLEAADRAARAGDYDRANVLLDSVSRILDSNGTFIDPLAITYQKIVRAAAEFDYELQQIDIDGATAYAVATQAPFIRLTTLNMEQRGQDWVILSH